MAVMSMMLVMGMVMACGGCAGTPLEKGYDVLNVSDTVYGATMTYIGDQYKAGKLDEADRDKVRVYAKKFKVAWKAAQAALITYKQMQDAGEDLTQQDAILQTVISSLLKAQTLLTEYVEITEAAKAREAAEAAKAEVKGGDG